MSTNLTASNDESDTFDVMMILQMLIASVGIVANFTVIFAFSNHKQLRRKIPNMFIINQVSYLYPVLLVPLAVLFVFGSFVVLPCN